MPPPATAHLQQTDQFRKHVLLSNKNTTDVNGVHTLILQESYTAQRGEQFTVRLCWASVPFTWHTIVEGVNDKVSIISVRAKTKWEMSSGYDTIGDMIADGNIYSPIQALDDGSFNAHRSNVTIRIPQGTYSANRFASVLTKKIRNEAATHIKVTWENALLGFRFELDTAEHSAMSPSIHVIGGDEPASLIYEDSKVLASGQTDADVTSETYYLFTEDNNASCAKFLGIAPDTFKEVTEGTPSYSDNAVFFQPESFLSLRMPNLHFRNMDPVTTQPMSNVLTTLHINTTYGGMVTYDAFTPPTLLEERTLSRMQLAFTTDTLTAKDLNGAPFSIQLEIAKRRVEFNMTTRDDVPMLPLVPAAPRTARATKRATARATKRATARATKRATARATKRANKRATKRATTEQK